MDCFFKEHVLELPKNLDDQKTIYIDSMDYFYSL